MGDSTPKQGEATEEEWRTLDSRNLLHDEKGNDNDNLDHHGTNNRREQENPIVIDDTQENVGKERSLTDERVPPAPPTKLSVRIRERPLA